MSYFSLDLTGQRFNKLTALRPTNRRSGGKVVWECVCDCGNPAYVASNKLRNGSTKSCGCQVRDCLLQRNITHGLTNTRLYRIWDSMKTRCLNPRSKTYRYYGGRGITICDEWRHDFKAFYDWAVANGYADHLTLDRSDGDAGYSPDNCKWSTWHEQRLNQRRMKYAVQNMP
jgi:hypothetical protein